MADVESVIRESMSAEPSTPPASEFPRVLFGSALVLTLLALAWLLSIAAGAYRDSEASAARARALGEVASDLDRAHGPAAAAGRAVSSALHVLAAEDDAKADSIAGRLLLDTIDASGASSAILRAKSALEVRAVRERRRAVSHAVGSVSVFGVLAFAWLSLTRSLERSRVSLLAEVRKRARIAEERRRIAEDLVRARDAALESARLKSAFIRNMGHEIRTPLSIVVGYAANLGDRLTESGDEKVRPMVEKMERAGRRLTTTIKGIMDLAKIESGGFEFAPRTIKLATLISDVTRRFEAQAREKGLDFSTVIDEPESTVKFDERCLDEAISNLIDNAIKFTERGSVVVRLARDDEGVLFLLVRDSGVGIAEAYLPCLYDAFSQEDAGVNRRFEGSGIGLTLARAYLGAGGAALTAESEKDRGSVFTVRFPRVDLSLPPTNQRTLHRGE